MFDHLTLADCIANQIKKEIKYANKNLLKEIGDFDLNEEIFIKSLNKISKYDIEKVDNKIIVSEEKQYGCYYEFGYIELTIEDAYAGYIKPSGKAYACHIHIGNKKRTGAFFPTIRLYDYNYFTKNLEEPNSIDENYDPDNDINTFLKPKYRRS